MKKFAIVSLLLLSASCLFAAEGYLQRGGEELRAGQYRKAIQSYRLAIVSSQDQGEAYKGIGLAYYGLGNHEVAYDVEMISAAVDAFKKSLAIRPDGETCYLLGLSYLALYDKENAVAAQRNLNSIDRGLAEKLAQKISAYAKPAKISNIPLDTPPEATAVVIAQNRVLVPVTFFYQGRSARATLLLDTGASVTTISRRVASLLGVAPEDMGVATMTVADGRSVGARWFVADAVAVGAKKLPQLTTAVLSGSGDQGHDGLLGMNFLKHFRYRVDFTRKVIDWKD